MLLRHYNKNSSWGPQCSAAEKKQVKLGAPKIVCGRYLRWWIIGESAAWYSSVREVILPCLCEYWDTLQYRRYHSGYGFSRMDTIRHCLWPIAGVERPIYWRTDAQFPWRLLNSALVATNFSGGKTSRSGKDRTTVTMWWETPCLTGVSLVQGLINDGKPSRSRVKGSPTDGGIKRKLRWGLGHSEDSAWIRAP